MARVNGINPNHDLQTQPTPEQKATTWSCVAMYYRDAFETSEDTADMIKASMASNESAWLGLMTPITLTIASVVEPLREESFYPHLL